MNRNPGAFIAGLHRKGGARALPRAKHPNRIEQELCHILHTTALKLLLEGK